MPRLDLESRREVSLDSRLQRSGRYLTTRSTWKSREGDSRKVETLSGVVIEGSANASLLNNGDVVLTRLLNYNGFYEGQTRIRGL